MFCWCQIWEWKSVPGNNSCARDSGRDSSEMASLHARSWPCLSFPLWLLCDKTFPLVFSLLPLILHVGGSISFGKYWASPWILESQRGASVMSEELSCNLGGFYPILVPSWTVGTQGKLLHLSRSCLLPSSEDKYLRGCEALGCDGCRGLRDLRHCTCDYSVLTELVCCGKYKPLSVNTEANSTFISLLSVGNILLINLRMSEGQGWCWI